MSVGRFCLVRLHPETRIRLSQAAISGVLRMSFWKSLFGSSKASSPGEAKVAKQVEYNGYLIEAKPYPEAGQYQVAGTVSKSVGDDRKEHRFVRADRFATLDEAADVAIIKGRQLVDQSGDRMFG